MGEDTDIMFCHKCQKPLHEKVSCLWRHLQKWHPEDKVAAQPLPDLPSDDQLLTLLRYRSAMCDDMLKDVSSKVNGAVEMLKESLEVKLNEQVSAKIKEEVGKMALVLSNVEGSVNFGEGEGAMDTIHTVFDKLGPGGEVLHQVEILLPSMNQSEIRKPSKTISESMPMSNRAQ